MRSPTRPPCSPPHAASTRDPLVSRSLLSNARLGHCCWVPLVWTSSPLRRTPMLTDRRPRLWREVGILREPRCCSQTPSPNSLPRPLYNPDLLCLAQAVGRSEPPACPLVVCGRGEIRHGLISSSRHRQSFYYGRGLSCAIWIVCAVPLWSKIDRNHQNISSESAFLD
jgi:hypothetical protein